MTPTRPSPTAILPPSAGRTWPITVGWLLLAVGLAVAYVNTFREMWTRWFPSWGSPTLGLYDRIVGGESYYTHGPLVPLISLLIAILLIRHTRIPVAPRRGLGFLVLGLSLGLHLLACLARVNFVSGFTLIGVLAGVVLIAWGTAALARLWFPLVLLTFMVPLPEVSIAQLNFYLRNLAAETGVALANFVGILVERAGNQGNRVVLEGRKELVIANICNGLRTLISLLGFGAIYAYVCKLKGGWRLFLFAMSVPVAVVSNSIRILGLIAVADIWDVPTATGMFHDVSGLLIYVVAFGLMFSIERFVLWVRQAVGRPAVIEPLFAGVLRGPDEPDPWPPIVRAMGTRAAWVAVGLILASAGAAFVLNRTVPSTWTQQMARGTMPATVQLDGLRWDSYDLTMDDKTLDILETRDYLYRRYVTAGAQPIDFCVVFSRDNRKGTHPPDLCLEGGGQDIVAKGDVVLGHVEGRGEIRGRSLVVQNGNQREYFLYVYKCGDQYTPSFWKQQLVIFSQGLLGRNPSGALIRVSTPITEDEETAARRARMMLGIAIPYLDRALP